RGAPAVSMSTANAFGTLVTSTAAGAAHVVVDALKRCAAFLAGRTWPATPLSLQTKRSHMTVALSTAQEPGHVSRRGAVERGSGRGRCASRVGSLETEF